MGEEKPRRRLVTFADIAAQPGVLQQGQAARPAEPAPVETPERATYARLVSLSKRPEDFGSPSGTSAPAAATPVSGTPVSPAPVTPGPPIGVPVSAEIPESGTPEPYLSVSSTPESSTPAKAAAVLALRRHIRQALTAKDGHSLGEQAVYEALWNHAEPHSADCRLVAIGYRTLSEACGLSVNNCKANLRALVRKLAIEEVAGHSYTQAKTYRVYNAAAILRRRKAAGLTHYIKTRGVVFVDLETGLEKGAHESGTPDSPEVSG